MNTAFKIDCNSYTEVTQEADPNDEWSNDSTYTIHNVNAITISNDRNFCVSGAFSDEDLVKNKEKVFLVYATYDNGDSFCTHKGSGIEYIECFLNREKAEEVVETIYVQYKIHKNYHYSDDGETLNIYPNKAKSPFLQVGDVSLLLNSMFYHLIP